MRITKKYRSRGDKILYNPYPFFLDTGSARRYTERMQNYAETAACGAAWKTGESLKEKSNS